MYPPTKPCKTDILPPKRHRATDTLGRVDFKFRIFDERAERKSTAIALWGDDSCRKWRRGQGSPYASQGLACTGKLNNVFHVPLTPPVSCVTPSLHSSDSDTPTSVTYIPSRCTYLFVLPSPFNIFSNDISFTSTPFSLCHPQPRILNIRLRNKEKPRTGYHQLRWRGDVPPFPFLTQAHGRTIRPTTCSKRRIARYVAITVLDISPRVAS